MGFDIGGLIGYITYRLLSALERLHGGGDEDFIRIILTFITMYVSYQLAIFLNRPNYWQFIKQNNSPKGS